MDCPFFQNHLLNRQSFSSLICNVNPGKYHFPHRITLVSRSLVCFIGLFVYTYTCITQSSLNSHILNICILVPYFSICISVSVCQNHPVGILVDIETNFKRIALRHLALSSMTWYNYFSIIKVLHTLVRR